MSWVLALLLGCDGEPGVASPPTATADATLYAEALAALPDQPRAAAELCARIKEDAMEADCSWATVDVLGGQDAAAAAALCGTLPERSRGECFFRLAEAATDLTWLARAGARRRRRLHGPLQAHPCCPAEPR